MFLWIDRTPRTKRCSGLAIKSVLMKVQGREPLIAAFWRALTVLGDRCDPTVYLETTIIGYLAMQPSGVLRIAANQQTTHEWWTGHRHRFSVYVSRFVVGGVRGGDSDARGSIAFVC